MWPKFKNDASLPHYMSSTFYPGMWPNGRANLVGIRKFVYCNRLAQIPLNKSHPFSDKRKLGTLKAMSNTQKILKKNISFIEILIQIKSPTPAINEFCSANEIGSAATAHPRFYSTFSFGIMVQIRLCFLSFLDRASVCI